MEKLSETAEAAFKESDSFADYIKTRRLEDFLCFDEIDHSLNVTVDSILGTKEEIFTLLKNSLFHENFLLHDVDKKVQDMDKSIQLYATYFLEDRQAKEKNKNKKNKFKNIYLTENLDSDLEEIDEENEEELREANLDTEILPSDMNHKPLIKKQNSGVPRKTINGCAYPGFNSKELTELAGFQETPQLLNNLSARMGFKSSFMRYWNPIIRSEASCAILQDSFWWFFLKYFKKDPRLEIDAYKYFSRISDSFVALFMSVDSSIRDRFFGNYANFLCQAVYMAFYKAFPDSRMLLNDDFKRELCDTIHEWILGIKPIPESYKDWEINSDINLSNNTDLKVTSTGEILQKITNLEKLLKNLGDKDQKRAHSVKFDEKSSTQVKPNSPARTEKRLLSSVEENKHKFITIYYDRNPSHVFGEGSVVEKFSFKLKGQSILIAHYLKIHNIQSEVYSARMTRSQITRQPGSGDITYKNLIDETIDKSKTLGIEYKKATSQTDIEVRKRSSSTVTFLDEKHKTNEFDFEKLTEPERAESARSNRNKNQNNDDEIDDE